MKRSQVFVFICSPIFQYVCHLFCKQYRTFPQHSGRRKLDRIKERCIRASAQGHYDYSCVTTVCEEARKGNRGWVWRGMTGSNPFPPGNMKHQTKPWWMYRMGPPKIAKLPYKWLNSMVYGRYNYSIHRVYKPNITGRHHPVGHETTYLWGVIPGRLLDWI